MYETSVYAYDVNLLGDPMKNSEALIDINKEVGLKVNAGKTKYVLLSCHQNAGQNHDVKVANGSFENVAKCRYCEQQ
jgi:hypothetical protein